MGVSSVCNKRIIQELDCDYLTADNKKNSEGIDVFEHTNNEDDQNTGISIEKRTIYNDLVEEIRKTLRFYMKSNSQSFFNTFYLTGGCANVPGLKDFIMENLNVKIEDFNMFRNIENNNKIENPEQYALVLGLALRGIQQ